MKNELVFFEEGDFKLEVEIKDETVWLNRDEIAMLFERDVKTIGKHINNILKEELDSNAVVANFATTAKDGKIYDRNYYNLDVIISVGYRVKSKRGTQFRIWANHILKEYLLKGYVINNKRLEYLEKTVQIISIANRIDDNLLDNEAKDILKVIGEYYEALELLDRYDYNNLSKLCEGTISQNKIKYEDCMTLVKKLKFNEKSELFALERVSGLESIISNLYLTYDGNDIYPTIEEKASNLLYLVVKDHVFVDGNKRIAATLFVYFLNFYNVLKINNRNIIDEKTLVAITLLIAQSKPNEKETIISLVMTFLNPNN